MCPDDLSPSLPQRDVRATVLPRVAVVGATGAVGVELRACLEQRGFPLASLRLLASPRSAGQSAAFAGRRLTVEALDERSFEGIDLALFSAGASVSLRYAPLAVKAGAVVVDNSPRFAWSRTCRWSCRR
jgi:aspartate-semialdehyde dehydrogenase